MIVDLTKLGQAGCVTTETKESAEAAHNAYNKNEFKTTKLVLRKIAKGQAYPVKLGATAILSDADVMTPQKDYYIGVFMVTKTQYDYVMNGSSSSVDMKPTNNLSYNVIRKNDNSGAMSPVDPVSNNSFMHRLVQGCLDAKGNPVGKFDLPTEVQWEIAARAGSFAAMGSYLDANWQWVDTTKSTLSQIAIYNNVGVLSDVGLCRPNLWGLYDMFGNMFEWCLDEGVAGHAFTDVETPYHDGTTENRMCRGGYFETSSLSSCFYPGYQTSTQAANTEEYFLGGIRVCHVVEE